MLKGKMQNEECRMQNAELARATRLSVADTRKSYQTRRGEHMASRQVFFENIEFAPTDEIKIFCFIAYGSSFFNRYDIGAPATCCRDARSLQIFIEIFCLIDRPSKDLYLALHNLKSKKHAVA